MVAKLATFLGLCALLLVWGIPDTASGSEPTLGADLSLGAADFHNGTHDQVTVGSDGLTLESGAVTGHYTSEVIVAPLAFNAVVPQWRADIPDSASLSILMRTGTTSGHWSQWYQLEENDDWMLPGEPDVVGQMIAVPAADRTHRRLQFSVSFSRYPDSPAATLNQLRFTFIDSSGGPSAAELLARQEALDRDQPHSPENGYPKPTVVSRDVWCTDPACDYSNGLQYVPVTHLIVHHTVTNNSSSDWAAVVRAIWYFHTFTRGWGDIGYNYLVDMNGVLYEGHLGGDDVVGTHAAGANAGSMALAFIGTFTSPNQSPPGIPPPAAMLDSAAELFSWKADQKSIDVYDAGYLPNMSWGLPKLMGHRDVYGTTTCPGDEAHALLPWLRDEVASRIGFVSPHIYVDEMTGAFIKSSSNWHVGPGNCGFDGHAYYTWSTTDPGQSTNWGEWRPPVAATGFYQLEVYAPYCLTGRAETDGADYAITHKNGLAHVVVSHDDHVGTWMDLGIFEFEAGGNNVVRLTDLTTTDSGLGVWFDAIRLRPLAPPGAITVANLQPSHGAWLQQRTVNFAWALSDPTWIASTALEVATDPNFNQIILSKNWSGARNSYNHAFNDDYANLYWRVVAVTLFNQTITSNVTVFGIDTVAPTSQVEGIYLLEDGYYVIYWVGTDATSGAVSYNVDYRAEGETSWTSWLVDTPESAVSFFPPNGRTYWLRSQATDAAGHTEPLHANGDMNTNQAVFLSRVIMLPRVSRN